MLRRWLGIAFASVVASTVLGYAYYIQQTIDGVPAWMMDLREPGPLIGYVAVTSVVTLPPVALFGSIVDSTLVRLRRHELWAYALVGLIAGVLVGLFLATFTPQSGDEEGRSMIAKVWHLALFGLTTSSSFWWVVRRSPDQS